ncbi:uncharacterized protein LOC144663240 [Oculina patagonica]
MKVFLLVFVVKMLCVCEAELPNHFYVQSENIYPLEFSASNVTCVAYDSAGVKVPEKIKFIRIHKGEYQELTANDSLFFTNQTEKHENKTKLFVTLHFRNVTREDDSRYGDQTYECHAFAKGDLVKRSWASFDIHVTPGGERIGHEVPSKVKPPTNESIHFYSRIGMKNRKRSRLS